MEEVVVFRVRDNEAFSWEPKRDIDVFIGGKTFGNETDLRNIIPGTRALVKIESRLGKYHAVQCIESEMLSPLVRSGVATVICANSNYLIIQGKDESFFAPGWTCAGVPASSFLKKKVHLLALPKRKESNRNLMAFCLHLYTSACDDVHHLPSSWASHWYNNKTNLCEPLADPIPKIKNLPPRMQSAQCENWPNENRFGALPDTSLASSSSASPLICAVQSGQDNLEHHQAAYDDDELQQDEEEMEEVVIYRVRNNKEAFSWAPKRNIEVFIGANAFENEAVLRNVIPGTQALVEIESNAKERNGVVTNYRAATCITSQTLSPLVISRVATVTYVKSNFIIIAGKDGSFFAPGWTCADVPASNFLKKKVHLLALPIRKQSNSHFMAFCLHLHTSACDDVHLASSWASHWYNKKQPPPPRMQSAHCENLPIENRNRFGSLPDINVASSSSTSLLICAGQSDPENRANNEPREIDDDELERDIEGILEEGVVFVQDQQGSCDIFIPSLKVVVNCKEENVKGGRYEQLRLGDRVKVDLKRERVFLGWERSFYVTEGTGIVLRVQKERHCVVRVETPEMWKGETMLAPRFAFKNQSLNPGLLGRKINFHALPSNPNPKYAMTPMVFFVNGL